MVQFTTWWFSPVATLQKLTSRAEPKMWRNTRNIRSSAKSGPGTGLFTQMFVPRHNILSYVRADIQKYVVTCLKHSDESNRPIPGLIQSHYDNRYQIFIDFTTIYFTRDPVYIIHAVKYHFSSPTQWFTPRILVSLSNNKWTLVDMSGSENIHIGWTQVQPLSKQ